MAVNLAIRVLVVEDNRTMGQILRNLLRLIGFTQVDNVFDGATALGMLREGEYGLVISDWNMQPMTGQELLEEVRADPGLKSVPFIMVTAESKLATITAAKDAGASGYIVKPFSGETLKQKIAAVLVSDRAKNANHSLSSKTEKT
jgi:two-component system, chemotaxis family, chemotaxis protein CheY